MRPVRGQTKRSALAVSAYRLLYHPGTREPRAPRRLILQTRLDALLRVLDADETRFYYAATGRETPETWAP
jgi:hypothetical protein